MCLNSKLWFGFDIVFHIRMDMKNKQPPPVLPFDICISVNKNKDSDSLELPMYVNLDKLCIFVLNFWTPWQQKKQTGHLQADNFLDNITIFVKQIKMCKALAEESEQLIHDFVDLHKLLRVIKARKYENIKSFYNFEYFKTELDLQDQVESAYSVKHNMDHQNIVINVIELTKIMAQKKYGFTI